jgi:hypothetical protein
VTSGTKSFLISLFSSCEKEKEPVNNKRKSEALDLKIVVKFING